MNERIISTDLLNKYSEYLIREEKSAATMEKYLRDTRAFVLYINHEPVTKERMMDYKRHLIDKQYEVNSINSMLASLNSFLGFLGWTDCKVKAIKKQRQIYCAEEKELTKAEYMRLVDAAKNNLQLQLVMQTICVTGIRLSELCFFTVEAVRSGEITVNCKAKTRTILGPGNLRKRLLAYAQKEKIRTGTIFMSPGGKPLDRNRIWTQMKQLCKKADVNPSKVFPHNLRKLFARTFYGIEKDIAKLADILGHSSIDTTRIYIMSTGVEHRRKIERLGLVV
ncbi:MAG: tyrosine-type recombinase/integrase [Lachnospiraceae bacterium]|nr:tyrosine-type recombinase/integrase [Lachnospiraceae bacterium]